MADPSDPLAQLVALAARFGVTREQIEECVRIQAVGASAVNATITEAASDRLDALRGRPISEILATQAYLSADQAAAFQTAVVAPPTVIRAGEGEPSESPAPPAPAGVRRFGNYELVRELGRGGMGVVYLAHHPGLKARFAVKVLLAGDDASADAVARFHREAQASARLRHPGIVAVHDIGKEEGKTYFAMEYVEGSSLDRVLADPPAAGLACAAGPNGPARGLPARVAIRMVQEIAEAIQAAHEVGVIHRDLKPANVIRDREGRLKVMDFGLAKMVDAGAAGATRTGTLMGTPAYMSPEQASGRTGEVDEKSDVYQLGAILYELLTGRAPYLGEAAMDVVLQVMKGADPPLPRRLNPRIDRDAETICTAAMARERTRRYASARALAEDCRRFRDGEAIHARPEAAWERALRWTKRRRAVAAAVAVALLFLLAAGVNAWRASTEKAAREAAEAESQRLAHRVLDELREKAGLFLDATLKLRRAGLPISEGKAYLGKLEHAAAEAVRLDSARPEPHFHLGRMLRALLRFDDALREQELALAKDPRFPPSLYERAVLTAGRYQRRLDQLRSQWLWQEGARLARKDPRGRPGLAAESPRSPPPDAALAASDDEARSHRERLRADLEVLGSAPLSPGGLSPGEHACAEGLGALLLGGPADADRAIEALQRSVSGGEPIETAYDALARLWSARREFDQAIATISRGIEVDRGFVPHHVLRGRCHGLRGWRRYEKGEDFTEAYGEAVKDFSRAIELDPTQAESFMARGRVHGDWARQWTGTGEDVGAHFAQAEADFGAALELDPGNAEARVSRGLARMNRGSARKGAGEDPDEAFRSAQADLEEALDIRPESAEAWMWLGAVTANRAADLGDRGDRGGETREAYTRAEHAFGEALARDPRSDLAWSLRASMRLNRATAQLVAGQPAEELFAQAEADYGKAIEIDPASATNRLHRGDAYMNWGELFTTRGADPAPILAKSEADYRAALELNPRCAAAWVGLCALHVNWGGFDSNRGVDPAAHLAKANEAAAHAVELSPAAREAWEARASLRTKEAVERLHAGQDPAEGFAAAVADWSKALAIDPRSATAWLERGRLGDAWCDWRAGLGLDSGEIYDRALKDLGRAVEINSRSVEAWQVRGLLQMNRGIREENAGRDPTELYRRAAADLARALELDGNNALSWMNQGFVRMNAAVRAARRGADPTAGFVAAEGDFTRAIELRPTMDEAWLGRAQVRNSRAWTEASRGRDASATYAQAEADFGKVMELDPRAAKAYSLRGRLRCDVGVFEANSDRDPRAWYRKSIEDLGKAIELAPLSIGEWAMRGAVRSNLGVCEAVVGNDPASLFSEADRDFQKATGLLPENGDAWMRWGVLDYSRATTRGTPAEQREAHLLRSVERFTRAIESAMPSAEAQWRRGLSRFHLGRWGEAVADFEKAIQADPSNEGRLRDFLAEARARLGGAQAPAQPGPASWSERLREGDLAVQGNDYAAARMGYEAGLALLAELDEPARAALLARPEVGAALMGVHYNLGCILAQASVGKPAAAAGGAQIPAGEAERLRSAAFEQLGRALDLGWKNASHLASDGDLEPLHADPRWAALIERARGGGK